MAMHMWVDHPDKSKKKSFGDISGSFGRKMKMLFEKK